MANDTKLTGDWSGAPGKIEAFAKKVMERLKKATLQNAVGLKGAIQEGIASGAPGGQQLAPLHPFTLSQRTGGGRPTRDSGGRFLTKAERESAVPSGKPLFDHGDLYGSITYKLSPDGLSATVGVNRTAKNKEGLPIINIAKVLNDGCVIAVTEKMRGYLHSRGLHLKPSTTHIVIPPRPFMKPSYLAYRQTIIDRYKAALEGK